MPMNIAGPRWTFTLTPLATCRFKCTPTVPSAPSVGARTITKNGKTLALRNGDGTPRWPNATADDPDGCGVPHGAVRY
jgi:hypothetical protein